MYAADGRVAVHAVCPRGRGCAPHSTHSLRQWRGAHAAGVTALVGTDAGQGPHGAIVHQITMLADAGMPVTEAIGCCPRGPHVAGSACHVSSRALLPIWSWYRADPRIDLDVLRRPALIVMDGQVIGSSANFAMRD